MSHVSLEEGSVSDGQNLLRRHWAGGTPVVGVWGQMAGWTMASPDPVLARALAELNRKESTSWRGLLATDPIPDEFYPWLAERFRHRAASHLTVEAARAPWFAVFTSSLDQGLANCLAGDGREPEVILRGEPAPRMLRNTRRPPFYYLFGEAGPHAENLRPPGNRQGLNSRRMQHSNAMLRRVCETATPLGLIVVDGYAPDADWLKADDLLAAISEAPIEGVLWCGPEPEFGVDDEDQFNELVSRRVIVRDTRPLGVLVSELIELLGVPEPVRWDDPELVSLKGGQVVKTTPNLRLVTHASAELVDDSWAGLLDPLTSDEVEAAFQSFHATATSFRSVANGVRRGFAIERSFEALLQRRIDQALDQHHNASAVIVHGQSGVGKTVAFARLAVRAKERGYAVLYANRRVPQASDLSDFLNIVDQHQGVTLLIVDTMSQAKHYDDLLRALRSVGHRVVVAGSSYRSKKPGKLTNRYIEATAGLDKGEQAQLLALARKFVPNSAIEVERERKSQYALAGFYRLLPHSRSRLSAGLGREVDSTHLSLRTRVAKARPAAPNAIAQALIDAGYPVGASPLLPSWVEDGGESPQLKAIELVMVSSRLFKATPLSIVLRAVSDSSGVSGTYDIDTMLDLIREQDLFRWIYSDEEQTDILVEARLQIEARLICDQRFGSAKREADAIVQLIEAATRAGPDNDETSYVVELIHAAGPDGPEASRYRDSYAMLARALTKLRLSTAIPNARLMLQESVLRRHYLRTHQDVAQDLKVELLTESMSVIDEAFRHLTENGPSAIFASRQTIDNLWIERAATYGFVAADMVLHGQSGKAYAAYKAAHDAASLAKARRDSSYALDVSLWIPTRILANGPSLTDEQRLEIAADLRSSLDGVDEGILDHDQSEYFQKRRMQAALALDDELLSDDAFRRLDEAGSTAGYFMRARQLAPSRGVSSEPSKADCVAAQACADYLRMHYDKVSQDDRCLRLLMDMEWIVHTGGWLMRGQRQPFPQAEATRRVFHTILLDMAALGEDKLRPGYRYLRAVTTWLNGNEKAATAMFNELAFETQFSDSHRVSVRHLLADGSGAPLLHRGTVQRQIGPGRFSVYVQDLGVHVDLIADYFPNLDLSVGRTVSSFAIAFNYRGPLADPPGGVRRTVR